MASGIAVNPEVIHAFGLLKQMKTYSYLILKIENKKEIVIDSSGPVETTLDHYEEFFDKLIASSKEAECRYAIYDFKYHKNNQIKSKPVYMLWNPDGAKVGSRMIYASSQDALKAALKIPKFEQVNDSDGLAPKEWVEFCLKHDGV